MIATIRKNLVNIPGWRTNRKILVIESDDWGSIRIPNKKSIEFLQSKGVNMQLNYFTALDSLESEEDLEGLFDLLEQYQDKENRHPVITANALVANPDFPKIQDSNFKEYHFETIDKTYDRYPGRKSVLAIWKEKGIGKRMLWPQFHGREHFNHQEWIRVLNAGEQQELLAFEQEVLLGLGNRKTTRSKNEYMAAFDYESEDEFEGFGSVIKQGTDLFEKTFGFRSKSFVAPCGIRSDKLDPILVANGIKYHQVGQQRLPKKEGYKYKNRFWGARNIHGQIYWRRNSIFEPSRMPNFDWVGRVLKDAKIAFRWGKPLVINSHRVNYSGGISKNNRKNTLRLLESLLDQLLTIYPDLEFFSSDQLGDLIFETSDKRYAD